MKIPAPLYKVELVAENGQHHYRRDGQDVWYPGVTTIQNAFPKQLYLVPWAAKLTAEKLRPYLNSKEGEGLPVESLDTLIKEAKAEHKRVKELAGGLGSYFHQMADAYIDGNEMLVPDELAIAWKSFLLWIKEEKPVFVMGDTKVLHPEMGYGGSFDAIIEEDGEPIIIDFKTSNRIDISYASQVGAYSAAFCMTYGIEEMPAGRIIRFDKNKIKYEQKYIANIAGAFHLFKTVKALNEALDLEYFSKKEKIK